jgi:hypothetical protein
MMPTCKVCKKHFGSRMSLWMHYSASKIHRKNSPYYHKPELWEQHKRRKQKANQIIRQYRKSILDYLKP